ncbi:MAG: hypothetical protein Q9160_002491 [Pyrenula sp. 1 TL-2023]
MSRKVEIASIFEFDTAVVDEVRQLGGGDFVSFNKERNLFSVECNDDGIPDDITNTLRVVHQAEMRTDLTDEPRLRRLPGTTLTNTIQLFRARYSAKNRKGSELLDYSDSDSHSESEAEQPSTSSHSSFKWKPASGILPERTFIEALMHGLHCIVDRHVSESYVDLRGEKLQLASRIIAPEHFTPQSLLNKHVSQLRTLTFEGISTPSNLAQQERLNKEVKRPDQSYLWSGSKYRQLGTNEPEAGIDQAMWGMISPDEDLFEMVNTTTQDINLSKGLEQSISKWAGEVGPTTDIDAVERPLDVGGLEVGKQRQVKDSDDESSDDSELQIQTASPAPNALSYSETRKAGKRRILKDSDDEPEASSHITQEALKHVASNGPGWGTKYIEKDRAPKQRQVFPKSMSRYDVDVISDTDAAKVPHSEASAFSDSTESLSSISSGAKRQTFISSESPENQATLPMDASFNGGFDRSKYSANGQTSKKSFPRSDTILVRSLTFTTSIPRIAEVFSDYGTIRNIHHEPEKGKAHITMSSPKEAQVAAKRRDGTMLEGRKIWVRVLNSQTRSGLQSLPRIGPKLPSRPSPEIYRGSHTQYKESSGSSEDERHGKIGVQRDLRDAKAASPQTTLQTTFARHYPSSHREQSLINTGSNKDIAFTENRFSDYAKDGLLPLPVETTSGSTMTEAQIQESSNPTPPLPLAPITTSRTPRSPSPQRSRGSDLYISTELPGINMAHIKKERLRSLEARVAKQAAMKQASQDESSQEASTTSSHSFEQLQARDEVSSRRFYNTMAQKAGKGKQTQNKAKMNQKRQNVLAETWPAPRRQHNTPTSQDETPRTLGASQITKLNHSQNSDNEYPHISAYNIAVATRLSEELAPIFNPLRAFAGQLAFKIELGQILIAGSKSHAICNNYPRELKEWDTVFNPPHGKDAPGTTFADYLTTNGQDVDHLLYLPYNHATLSRNDRRTRKNFIFDPCPEDRATAYEFHCLSKDNEKFLLTVTEAGDFHVRRPSQPLGFVNLHHIGQIWDARAVISGIEPFEVSSSLEKAIIELRDSIYIPEGRPLLLMSYKLPLGNEIRVQKMTCVRTTLHRCLRFPDIMVETVLIQDLLEQVRADDTDIRRAFSRPYTVMVNCDQVRWKVSFLSRNIMAALKENEQLVLGDLVKSWTTSSLLFETTDNKQRASTTIREMMTLTDSVVQQIDGVGYYNFGSLRRYAEDHGGVSGLGSLVYNGASNDNLVSPEGPLGPEDSGKKGPEHQVRAQDVIKPDDSASQAGGRGRPQTNESWRVTHQQGCGAKVMVFSLRRTAFRLIASPSTVYFTKARPQSTVAPSFLQASKRYHPIKFQQRWASGEAEAKEDAPISEVEPTPTEEIENVVQEDAATSATEPVEQNAASFEGATSTTEPEDRTPETTENWHSTDPATTSFEQDPARASPEISHEDKTVAQEAVETVQEKARDAASTVSNAASVAASAASSSMRPGSETQTISDYSTSFDPKPTIYIGNLFFDVTENDLVKAFSQYGKIVRSRLVRDARGLSKGFGYIDFDTTEAARASIENMNQKLFEGRRLRVQFAAFTSKTIDERAQRTHEDAPKNPPSKTLFVGNMSFEMTDRDLNQLFRSVKNVIDVRVAIDRRTGQPRGFAHADFIDINSAIEGMETLKQKEVYGRKLRVDFSITPDRARSQSQSQA